MAWTFESSTGKLYDPEMKYRAQGYSGGGLDATDITAAAGKNNPEKQDLPFIGPLPEGGYSIQAPVDSPTHGPYCMNLIPDPTNEMFGRDAFKLHGDSVVNPGWASEGCGVIPKFARVAIWESGDHRLRVQATVSA